MDVDNRNVRVCDLCFFKEKPKRLELNQIENIAAHWKSAPAAWWIRYLPRSASEVHTKGFGYIEIDIIKAIGLRASDRNLLGQHTSSDPYCIIKLENQSFRTKTIYYTLNPEWMETFKIWIRSPPTKLVIEVWDEDNMSKDDFLGQVVLDMTQLWKDKKGYFRLLKRDGSVIQGGGLKMRLSRTTKHYTREFWGHILQPRAEAEPVELPVFNVDEIYMHGMIIADIWYFGCVCQTLEWISYVLHWKDVRLSFAVMLVYVTLCLNSRFLPSFCLASLAVLHLRMRSQRKPGRVNKKDLWKTSKNKMHAVAALNAHKKIHKDDSEIEEKHLGAVVRRFANMLPGWVRTSIHPMQPITIMISEVSQDLHLIYFWNHPLSFQANIGLWVASCLFCLVPTLMFAIIGVVVLLLHTPVMTACLGIVQYFRPPTGKIYKNFSIQMQDSWMSSISRKNSRIEDRSEGRRKTECELSLRASTAPLSKNEIP